MPELEDARKGLYSDAWRNGGRTHTTNHEVPGVPFRPELAEPKPYEHQEYPKWVFDQIVVSEEEEKALLAANAPKPEPKEAAL